MLDKLLSTRGVLYLVTRFGGTTLRRRALAQNYATQGWQFLDENIHPEIVSLLEKHSRVGQVLELGCGNGRLAAALNPESYAYYHGVDICPEAVEQATQRGMPNAVFECADIHGFTTSKTFDMIVFEESLYYVNPLKQKGVLRRYRQLLRPDGVLVVTVLEPGRFARTIRLIREDYEMIEEGQLSGTERLFFVFR